jgi:hypothetical protein
LGFPSLGCSAEARWIDLRRFQDFHKVVRYTSCSYVPP